MREALLVAQLYAAKVQYAILHGRQHALALAGMGPLVKRGKDAERQVQAGAQIADLGAGHGRRAIEKARGGGRAASTLGNVLVHLALFMGPGPKPFTDA